MSDKTRRSILRTTAVAGAGLAGLIGAAGATETDAAQTIELYDDFTWGLYGWETDTDLKEGIKGTIEHSTEKTASGWWNGCVETYIEGYEDDGTVWLETAVDVDPYTTYDVRMSVSGYNPTDTFNNLTYVHAILDSENIESEADIRNSDDDVVSLKSYLRSADEQFETYSTTGTYKTGESTTAYFAFGTNLVYELDQRDYLDDVSLWMVPR